MQLENIDPKTIITLFVRGFGSVGVTPSPTEEIVFDVVTEQSGTEYSYTYVREVRVPITTEDGHRILRIDANEIFALEVMPDEDA